MKTVIIALIAGLAAGVLGAYGLRWSEPATGDALGRSDGERLLAIEGRIERLEAAFAEDGRQRLSRDDLAEALTALDRGAEIEALRGELDALRGIVRGEGQGADLAATTADEEELIARLEERLAARRARDVEIKQEERRQQENAWNRARIRNRARGFARKLDLDEAQTERLTAALAERDEADAGLWGAVKGAEGDAEARLAAIRQWRANRDAFEQRARGFMSTDQAERMIASIREEESKVSSWLDQVESELGADDGR